MASYAFLRRSVREFRRCRKQKFSEVYAGHEGVSEQPIGERALMKRLYLSRHPDSPYHDGSSMARLGDVSICVECNVRSLLCTGEGGR